MNPHARTAAGLVLLVLLLYLAGCGYWHFKISGTIAALESGAVPASAGQVPPWTLPPEALASLKAAGSRALPYLAESLRPSSNPLYLAAASAWLRKALERAGGRPLRPLTPTDNPDERWQKCAEHRQAWEDFGSSRYSSWFWWRAQRLE